MAENNYNNSDVAVNQLTTVNKFHESDTSVEQSIDNKTDIFGTRYLKDPARVYEHNAWDSVEWSDEQIAEAEQKIAKHSTSRMSAEDAAKQHLRQQQVWNDFYLQHHDNFFKDRNWLFSAFSELYGSDKDIKLAAASNNSQISVYAPENAHTKVNQYTNKHENLVLNLTYNTNTCSAMSLYSIFSVSHINALAQKATVRILDAGCGVGNSTFPILESNPSPNLFVYCFDFAKSAIKLIQDNPSFSNNRIYPFICDLTSPTINLPFPPNSIDYILLLFVLSAIPPCEKMELAVARLSACLKPGGLLLFRDYGRYDMAQLRFKAGSCMENDCYMRGDGTQAFFFTEEKVRQLFVGVGQLDEIQLESDRRLQVNRGKMIKMYRIWIQAKFAKPLFICSKDDKK